MSVPLCPLFVAARAAHPGDGEYRDPTLAPGCRCLGSRCAAWAPVYIEGRGTGQREGRCGMTPYSPDQHESQTFTDPAAQEVSHG